MEERVAELERRTINANPEWKHKGLLARIERLLAQQNDRVLEIRLRDGSVARLAFREVIQGCSGCMSSVQSYPAYIVANAVGGNEFAMKAVDMMHAISG
jgi:hypothetical protein